MLLRIAAALLLLAAGSGAAGGEVRLGLPLPYRLLEEALAGQVFQGADGTVRVLEDANACNTLTLSEPAVEGRDGRVRLLARMASTGGTPLPDGRCLPLFDWSGRLAVEQEPYVLPGRLALGFRVVGSSIVDPAAGERQLVPDALWRSVMQLVHPRLEHLVLDLEPPLEGVRELLRTAFGTQAADALRVVDSLRLEHVRAGADALHVEAVIAAPDPPAGWAPTGPQPVLGIEELERWRQAWQSWDAFATWAIKELARDVDPGLRAELAAVLLDARHDLLTALAADTAADPVRELFIKTWDRLAPHLRSIERGVPGAEAARLLGFIAAGDALAAIDRAAPQLGLRFDRDTLRALARLLLPGADDSVFEFDGRVDPELRSLLGFPSALPRYAGAPRSPWAWLLREAHAADAAAAAERLDGWVPSVKDLDEYLAAVDVLLERVAAGELERGKVPPPYAEVYRTLLQATAWQETCWRQYVMKSGSVHVIQSSAGSVGLMQVNKHVWRGVYDVDALMADIGYNARAGNEILVHYLVDHALRKDEHRHGGSREAAARATYAAYNGGPSHLARYRKADTPASLRHIDEAFWRKYQQVKTEGARAVRACYGG